ncbi:MAG: tRNA glutamyl-Q(34) synthetase GluQRS, partial [Pseudomonadota bacterium]
LDLPEPRYHHHGLILDQHGRKLSKSSGSTGLAELRAAGKTAQDVRVMLGY